MPRLKTDYSKIVIYKLVCKDYKIQDIYIGSTTDYTKRKSAHKYICNNVSHKNYNNKTYKIIRENGGWENWCMILIENYPCKNKREAEAKERYWFDELNAKLNTYKPYTTDAEKKNYYNENKDKILTYKKTKFDCECNGKYTQSHKSTHLNTLKHKCYLSLQTETKNTNEQQHQQELNEHNDKQTIINK